MATDEASGGDAEINDDMRDQVGREVGRRIKARREALGLSQTELGRRLVNSAGNPVSGSQIGRWENGVFLRERRMWRQLATALETTLDAIFGGLVADMPDERLADRLGQVEAELQAVIGILNLGQAVSDAIRAARSAQRRQDPESSKSLAERIREAAAEPLRSERQTTPTRRSGS